MVHYTTLTKEIIQITSNNKCTDTLTYAYIKFRENYNTNISNVTYPEIAAHTGIPESTLENIMTRTKSCKFLFAKVDSKDKPDKDGRIKTYNSYYFPKSFQNFFYIDNQFFKDSISEDITDKERIKLKGFLLLLKAVCYNETNKFISKRSYKGGVSKSELAIKIGMDTDTLTSLLDLAKKYNQIKDIPKGIMITNRYIIPDYIESCSYTSNPKHTEIYHLIYYWCISKGIIPPDREDTITAVGNRVIRKNPILSIIAGKYNITDSDLIQLAADNNMEINSFLRIAFENAEDYPILNNYLPYVLETRVTNKPEVMTWNYITKVLNISQKDNISLLMC